MKKQQKSTKNGSRSKRKYVESHWLIFALQGIIALLAGWFFLFTGNESVSQLVIIIGSVLIGLAVVEMFNIVHRHRRQHDWGIVLGVAILEAAVGIAMIVCNSIGHELHIALLAGYTVIRSVSSIIIGFASFSNMTDRFLWVVCGMVGCVIGFVILADPGISTTTFVKIFGTYLMVLGLTELTFAAHSRDELKQIAESKKAKK